MTSSSGDDLTNHDFGQGNRLGLRNPCSRSPGSFHADFGIDQLTARDYISRRFVPCLVFEVT